MNMSDPFCPEHLEFIISTKLREKNNTSSPKTSRGPQGKDEFLLQGADDQKMSRSHACFALMTQFSHGLNKVHLTALWGLRPLNLIV